MTRRRLLGGLLGGAASLMALGVTSCQLQPGPRPAAAPEPLTGSDQPAAPLAAPPAPDAPPAVRAEEPAVAVPARVDRGALDGLLPHLGLEREEFEPVEARYFAGLRELLAWHKVLGPTDGLDRHNFDEALRRFQAAHGLAKTGLPDDATLWALGSAWAKSRQLELVRVEADLVPGREGQDSFDLRQDVADRYRQLRAAVKELGGGVTSAGSSQALTAPTTPGRQPASLHHAGLVFDLAPSSGMQNRLNDPYVITQEGAGWRVWARAEGGEERELTAVFWHDGKTALADVKARLIDFTALAQQHGFRGVGADEGFPEKYSAAEWWRFRCEDVLTPFLSQLGVELLSLRRYSEDALRAAGEAWERRTDRFVFDRDRGGWRFGGSGPRITAEAAARYYQVVSDQIRRTLREYQEIPVTVPAGDPLGESARRQDGPPTELTVRTPYWINDGEDAALRAKQVASAHPDLQSAFKDAPFNARVAKGTPSEIRAAVERALGTGRIRGANGAWPPTRADVQAWMRDFGVGVDCSGFVYEALTRIEKALAARSLGRLAVPRLGPPTTVPSRHAKQGYPVGRPRDLSVGDLVFLPPQPNNPIGHVRIVDSVEAVGDGVVFTAAESTFDADGPRSMRWRFPDGAALANLEWYVDGRWQPAREREHTGSFWRHLPLMHTGLTTIV